MNLLPLSPKSIKSILCTFSLLIVAFGCATNKPIPNNQKASINPLPFYPNVKSKLRIGLVSSPELKTAAHENKIASGRVVLVGSTFVPILVEEDKPLIIGEIIITNCEGMAKALFSNVCVGTESTAWQEGACDYILTPQLKSIEDSPPTSNFGCRKTTIIMEWRITDPRGNLLWVDTATGDSPIHDNRITLDMRIKKAIAAMISKSFIAVANSPVVFPTLSDPAHSSSYTTQLQYTDPEIQVMRADLHSADIDKIVHALKVLKTMDSRIAIPEILPLLKHEKRGVIRDSCRTLAVIANKDVIPSIEPLLKHSDSKVRKDAEDAILKLQAKP